MGLLGVHEELELDCLIGRMERGTVLCVEKKERDRFLSLSREMQMKWMKDLYDGVDMNNGRSRRRRAELRVALLGTRESAKEERANLIIVCLCLGLFAILLVFGFLGIVIGC